MDFIVHILTGYWQLLVEPNIFVWAACITLTYLGIGGLEEPDGWLGLLFWFVPLLLRPLYAVFLIGLSPIIAPLYLAYCLICIALSELDYSLGGH